MEEKEKMNFGQNLYNWFSSQAQPIVIVGIIVMGIFLLWQKKLTELVAFAVVAVIAVGLVFNPYGVKDALLNVFNTLFGVSGTALGISGQQILGTAAGLLL